MSNRVQKCVRLSKDETEMLADIAAVFFAGSKAGAVRSIVNAAFDNKPNGKFTGEIRDEAPLGKNGTVGWSTNVRELRKISELCAYYGASDGTVIRYLIRAFYAEHEKEIASALAYSAESESEIEIPAEIPAEPTATQMPLPEPLSEAEAIAARIEAERMHDDGEFRGDLLKVLGRIADGLDALNESRSADSAELGRITNQLKTLNNAVWNR